MKRTRRPADATVMQMVQHQAVWFATLDRGDGEVSTALWEAGWAQEWPTVRSE